MAIFDLFSKRQKRLRGEIPEILTYDYVPKSLRISVAYIIRDAIGDVSFFNGHNPYRRFKEVLCREYGLLHLTDDYNEKDEAQVHKFFVQTKDNYRVIDVIELIFKYIDRDIRDSYNSYSYQAATRIKPDDAIAELNQRFKEGGIGYGFEGGEIIKIDSTYAHSEITKPTISLLWSRTFQGANEEFLKAHDHYKNGRNKECLTECLKAFESTLKIICKEKKWTYKTTDSAKKLIQIAFDKGLVPTFTQNQFTSLKNLLESGIPTIRNKLGGHGQGQIPQKVDDGMTRYGLNLTGTNIIFLIEQSGIK